MYSIQTKTQPQGGQEEGKKKKKKEGNFYFFFFLGRYRKGGIELGSRAAIRRGVAVGRRIFGIVRSTGS